MYPKRSPYLSLLSLLHAEKFFLVCQNLEQSGMLLFRKNISLTFQ
uniref:Uncharacterized protein n=1 Tax=Anguilla anguilla TaxID=7936 RepID=A0A0E9XWA0_ANGAN